MHSSLYEDAREHVKNALFARYASVLNRSAAGTGSLSCTMHWAKPIRPWTGLRPPSRNAQPQCSSHSRTTSGKVSDRIPVLEI